MSPQVVVVLSSGGCPLKWWLSSQVVVVPSSGGCPLKWWLSSLSSAATFGIALPSWIVDKKNSGLVLGLYVLVFMVAMPVAIVSG